MANPLHALTVPPREQLLRLPTEMQALPQWALAGASKAPQSVHANGKLFDAASTRPKEWRTFEEGLHWAKHYASLVTTDTDKSGRTVTQTGLNLGYMLDAADPFTIIDLDVKDATTHPDQPELWTTPEDLERFVSIIRTFDSYTERSRSGKGFHIIVKGKIGKGRKRDGVELYSQERFIICTGDVYLDRPVRDGQALLDNMISIMPRAETTKRALDGDPSPDWALAERALRDGGELGKLFRGDWDGRYTSHSDADLALLKLLLPHVETPRECWETFRLSILGKRDKAKRPDYARSTMAMAIAHLENDAEQVRHGKALAEAMGLTGDQAQQRGYFWPVPTHNPARFRLQLDEDLAGLPPPRWLVKGIIPEQGIGSIYGDSGSYKSFLTLDLLAHVSNGKEWFGRKVNAAPAVYVPFEGRGGIPQRVNAWRLAQANLRRPDALLDTTLPDDVRSNVAFIMEPMNLREKADREDLVSILLGQGWAGGILCIDTLAQASSGLDENSSEMAEMITIFEELQRRLGGVVLVRRVATRYDKLARNFLAAVMLASVRIQMRAYESTT